jgi:hypothetical protein
MGIGSYAHVITLRFYFKYWYKYCNRHSHVVHYSCRGGSKGSFMGSSVSFFCKVTNNKRIFVKIVLESPTNTSL